MNNDVTQLRRGQLVQVAFNDHSILHKGTKEKNSATTEFVVWGRVKSVTQKQLVLEQWALTNGTKEDKAENNVLAKVLRSTIISVKRLGVMAEDHAEFN